MGSYGWRKFKKEWLEWQQEFGERDWNELYSHSALNFTSWQCLLVAIPERSFTPAERLRKEFYYLARSKRKMQNTWEEQKALLEAKSVRETGRRPDEK